MNNNHLETLNEIKSLMHRSSKFTALSGLSGIAAGIVATAGSVIFSLYFHLGFFEQVPGITLHSKDHPVVSVTFVFILLCTVFILAAILAVYFSSRNAKSRNIIFRDAMAKRVIMNFAVFLLTGGIFCMILFYYGIYFLIVSSMLIFYGLALINVSKFTFNENARLGVLEICLGILAALAPEYPLLIWVTGFGLLHIVFGIYVYLKYESAGT